MGIITTNKLTKRYGARIGADRVDLDVPEGSIFGFLGPNGAGKTTTIRLLLGFLRASEGSASILGRDCWAASHHIKRDLGYLPGDLRLYPWMTASDALRFVSRVRGNDLRDVGSALAERFSLDLDLRVRKMSLGMRQKLGLILAMAHAPRLLVLDEPTSGLDPLMQDALGAHLRELARNGCTVFFSSHTLSTVEKLCDRVAIVRAGRIVADETLDALRRRARRQVVIQFIDANAARATEAPSFLDVRVRRDATWRCQLTGPSPELIKWAALLPIDDLMISQPDLESVFRRYYLSDEEQA